MNILSPIGIQYNNYCSCCFARLFAIAAINSLFPVEVVARVWDKLFVVVEEVVGVRERLLSVAALGIQEVFEVVLRLWCMSPVEWLGRSDCLVVVLLVVVPLVVLG